MTALRQSTAADQPFVPDVNRALTRAHTLKTRRRMTVAGGTLGVLVLAGIATASLSTGLDRPDRVEGQFAQAQSTVAFAVELASGPAVDVDCALAILLPNALPGRISMPCDTGAFAGGIGQAPLSTRQDAVRLEGRPVFVTSGTAPPGTVAVTAADADDQPVTARLRSPDFTQDVVFVFVTDDDLVRDIAYTLADGFKGPTNTVFQGSN